MMMTPRRVTEANVTPAAGISFGSFHFRPRQQLLLNGETPVPLGSRAREILAALVERPGQVISKEELIARVWPDTFVEEGNLKVHVATLRRALGDGAGGNRFITNVPGRGYCFVAPVIISDSEGPAPPPRSERVLDAPAPLARMVGRTEVVHSLAEKLPQHRFITIVGPGGIGKTTVALAVARDLAKGFRDGVRFVDFSPLTDPQLVPSALATALGIPLISADSSLGLISHLADKHILLLLDNCEHLIEAIAALAEDVFNGASAAHILATSREPLRVTGERVHRLTALAAPPQSTQLTASEALAFPAVQLFVDRASTGLDPYELTDAEAPAVAEICRTLDGIALAIEIAAVRLETFGVAGLAARLDDRFRLLMRGRRTALTRHQTLSTALDWSHDLLPEVERIALRRLSVFGGYFSIEAAVAILSQADTPASEIVDRVANLVAKSLVSASIDAGTARYRLLDTTRAYAFLKLEESGERDRVAGWHAEYYRRQLERAEVKWETQLADEWLEEHRHLIDDVRAALDWSFSPGGDATLGVSLTVAAVPLWFQLLLVSECCGRVETALSAPEASRSPRAEMALYAALAWSLAQTRGSVDKTREARLEVLRIAEALGDVDYQLRAIWGLWAGLLNQSEFREALALARRFRELAARHGFSADLPVGDRMVGYILHLMGDQNGARRHIESMLRNYVAPVTGARIIRFIFDQKVTARCFLARVLWLQGFPDQAARTVEDIVEVAASGEDMLTLCQALVQAACPVGLLVGDLERVDRFVEMLLGYSTRNGLDFWQAYGRCFKGALLVRRGDASEALSLLTAGLAQLRDIQYGVYYNVFLGDFAEASALAGNAEQGLASIGEALERADRQEGRWCSAELLRIKATILLRSRASDAVEQAEACFLASLDIARQQQTLSWELRTATHLARLWRDRGAQERARELLLPVYDRFAEGFETADLRDAREFLSDPRR
jgi:predicted ATPase/DNA-binding winged helix-turn-helix (wHTH) protein